MNSQPGPTSQSMPQSDEIFRLLPWRWRVTHWISTIILLIPAVAYTLLAFCNPFWFREAMLQSGVNFIEYLGRTRDSLMRPALQKYCLLESLKQGKNII